MVTQDVSPLSAFDAELLRLTNAKRAAAGTPALQEARGLDSLSSWWSNQEASGVTGGKLQHNPDGWTMVTTYGAAQRTLWGENVVKWSPATATPQQIFDAYWSSATHRANLLNKSYKYIGIGTVTNSAGVSFNTINFSDAADGGQTYDPKAAATPTGQYESLTLAGATVSLSGWAVDPDITTAASVITVKDTAADGTVASYTTPANVARNELSAKFPAAGAAHGFAYSYLTAGRGSHSVCATVVNQGAGIGDVDLGCLTYSVGNPVGSFDTATTPTQQAVSVTGWTVDPAAANTANTITAKVTNSAGTIETKGIAAGAALSADAPVAGAGRNHGYSATVPLTADGDNSICLSAVSVDGKVSTDLGCKTVTVNSLGGWLDRATAATDAAGKRTIKVEGWAVDKSNLTATSNVRLDLTNAAGKVLTSTVAANTARPDVGRAVPGAGNQHGYISTVTVPAAGAYKVCGTALSTRNSAVTKQLTCVSVTVK